MSSEGTHSAVRVNRPGLVAVVTIATAIGGTPYVLLTEQPWVAAAFALVALAGAIVASRKLTTRATQGPGHREWLLALTSAVAEPAAAAFMGIVFYGCGYSLARSIEFVTNSLGGNISLHPSRWAFGLSLTFALTFLLGNTFAGVEKLCRQLYPPAAGLRSSFYALAAFRPWRAYGSVLWLFVLLAVGTAIVPVLPGVLWITAGTLFFAMLIIAAALPLQQLGEGDTKVDEPKETLETIKGLFEAGGYEVVASPRTGREDIDPLLVHTPDFYAQQGDRAFTVAVKTKPGADEQALWKELSELSSATWALSNFINEGGDTPAVVVEPLVVLVGLERPLAVQTYETAGLERPLAVQTYETAGEVRALQVERARLKAFQTAAEPAERKKIAESFLEGLDRQVAAS